MMPAYCAVPSSLSQRTWDVLLTGPLSVDWQRDHWCGLYIPRSDTDFVPPRCVSHDDQIDRIAVLTLVPNDSAQRIDRLRVVHAHLIAAIAHLNNETQARVPVEADENLSALDDLQLMVRALADIVDAWRP
jgi:hypothetical protein